MQPEADLLTTFLDDVPQSVLGPLTDNGKVLGTIIFALAFGLACATSANAKSLRQGTWSKLLLVCLVRILHWVITLVPLAVSGIIASIASIAQGFAALPFIGPLHPERAPGAVAARLLLPHAHPLRLLGASVLRAAGVRDALVMAFSTASSTATMPVTLFLSHGTRGAALCRCGVFVREPPRLMKLQAFVVSTEHPIDDGAVKVQVHVEPGAEAMDARTGS